MWLDYDDPLDTAMLNDIALCVDRLCSGSVLVVSASAQLAPDPEIRLIELTLDIQVIARDDLHVVS
jgi:hypothetical protein